MALTLPMEGVEASSDSGSSSTSRHDDLELERNGSGIRKRRKLSHDGDELPSTLSRIKKTKAAVKAVSTPETYTSKPFSIVKDFTALKVAPWLVGALAAMAIQRPTGIQSGCIPEILAGRDCIGGSRTGSGKTVAFAVPILQKWAQDPVGIYAVVLTPTR